MIIPAGYVGGAFWAGAFVALSGHRIGATVGAVIISMALMGSLCYKPNKTVVYISVGFTILTLAAIAIDWFVIDPFLQVRDARCFGWKATDSYSPCPHSLSKLPYLY
jgi:Peptidase M50B-like